MEDLRHLSAFVAAADELHLGRAAAAVGVTRAVLSARLRRLETEVGMTLVDRSHRCRIALTPEGAALLPVARRTLDTGREFAGAVEAVRSGERGVVPVALDGDPEPRAERVLRALADVHPGWRIETVRMDRASIPRALAVGGVECAITSGFLGGTARSGWPDPRPNRHERQVRVRVDGRPGHRLFVAWRRRWANGEAPAHRVATRNGEAPAHRVATRNGEAPADRGAARHGHTPADRGTARHGDTLARLVRELRGAAVDATYPSRVRARRAAASRQAAWRREAALRGREEQRLGSEIATRRARARERRRELLRLWKGVVRGDPDVCELVDAARAAGIDVGLGLDTANPPRGPG